MILRWNTPRPQAETQTQTSDPVVGVTAPPPQKVAQTTADLKAGVGSVALAVVAPRSGPIDVPAGTPVIVVAKDLWQSPTIKKLRQAVYLAWAAFWGYVVVQVLIVGGPFKLSNDQWIGLLKDASYPALLTAAAAYGVTLKKADNDPTVR